MGIEALLQSQVIGLNDALAAKLSLTGGTLTGDLTFPDGRSIWFNGGTCRLYHNGGNLYVDGTGFLGHSTAAGVGTATHGGAVGGLLLGSSRAIQWSSVDNWYETKDLFLLRDASNTLAQRNGAAAQKHHIYNTWTNNSNYERLQLVWESNEARIGPRSAGTGTGRNLVLGYWDSSGTWRNRLELTSSWVSIYTESNTAGFGLRSTGYDALFFNNLRLGFENGASGIGDIYIGRHAANVLGIYATRSGVGSVLASLRASNASLTGNVELSESSTPTTPSANCVVIYAEDNGSGKTRLMALFASGAAQQIALQP